jgi:5'-phosphate synthase pdxT subunit
MLDIPAIGAEPYHAVFIRGPVVEQVGEGVEVLARIAAPEPNIVAVRQNLLLATAFHPEVTEDLRFHEYFLGMVQKARAAAI